ncbi:hypothetical protein VFPFJ_00320 [Purpureocillium lilacinum]|uniref:Uncharacterized protein n=1 Tax=Purpureocillium lilacinum TaxID=33203 RepID=A0A179HXD3_PURLI|nr:hypothetical protein VFPFJ_00320 [Purpureocillium lilacinum]OAQ86250.1 hypothetical protein VFPBJ_00290 [Purpureocillium lilacinum]OAQ94211.1 hypothetical protein VFPFJ_00320 [Purpureocillium lilacinum]
MRLPIASGGFVSAILLCLLAFTAAVPHGKWQKDRGRRMEARDSPPSYYDDPGNTYNPPPPYYGDPGKTYGNPPPYDFGTSSLATISTSNSYRTPGSSSFETFDPTATSQSWTSLVYPSTLSSGYSGTSTSSSTSTSSRESGPTSHSSVDESGIPGTAPTSTDTTTNASTASSISISTGTLQTSPKSVTESWPSTSQYLTSSSTYGPSSDSQASPSSSASSALSSSSREPKASISASDPSSRISGTSVTSISTTQSQSTQSGTIETSTWTPLSYTSYPGSGGSLRPSLTHDSSMVINGTSASSSSATQSQSRLSGSSAETSLTVTLTMHPSSATQSTFWPSASSAKTSLTVTLTMHPSSSSVSPSDSSLPETETVTLTRASDIGKPTQSRSSPSLSTVTTEDPSLTQTGYPISLSSGWASFTNSSTETGTATETRTYSQTVPSAGSSAYSFNTGSTGISTGVTTASPATTVTASTDGPGTPPLPSTSQKFWGVWNSHEPPGVNAVSQLFLCNTIASIDDCVFLDFIFSCFGYSSFDNYQQIFDLKPGLGSRQLVSYLCFLNSILGCEAVHFKCMELLSYHSFACFNSHLDFLSAIPYPIKLDQLYSSKAELRVDEHLCTRKLQLWPFRHRRTETHAAPTTFRTSVAKSGAGSQGVESSTGLAPVTSLPNNPNYPWGGDSPIHRHENVTELNNGMARVGVDARTYAWPRWAEVVDRLRTLWS